METMIPEQTGFQIYHISPVENSVKRNSPVISNKNDHICDMAMLTTRGN